MRRFRLKQLSISLISTAIALAAAICVVTMVVEPGRESQTGSGRLLGSKDRSLRRVTVPLARLIRGRNPDAIQNIRVPLATIPRLREIASPIPVVVPLAGLLPAAVPAHAWAPPRDPDFYRTQVEAEDVLPPDPAGMHDLLRANAAMDRWLQTWCAGSATTARASEIVEAALAGSHSLAVTDIYRLGESVRFVDGDRAALPFFRRAILAAERELPLPNPLAGRAHLLHVMDQMSCALSDLHDWTDLVALYHVCRRHIAAGSSAARRTEFMEASALYSSGDADRAAELIEDAARYADKEADLAPVDIAEMEFCRGMFLFYAGRFREAIPHLRNASMLHRDHGADALAMLASALARSGNVAEAAEVCESLRRANPTHPLLPTVQAEVDAVRAARSGLREGIR